MIKKHKLYTKSERTSSHCWEANQFRLFLRSRAYWLLYRPRHAASWKSLRRRAFLKIVVRIENLKSCVRAALPSSYPYRKVMISTAGRIAAQGP